jgi:CO/xanthine dehydrogenase FAD-binding subunit
MRLPEFELHLPTSLEETLKLLQATPPPVLMAGGTDLMVQMKRQAVSPAAVVGLSLVPGLDAIRDLDGGVSIGGAATITKLENDALLLERAPAVVDAARCMATVQVRNRATVAGNLATAAACADLPPVLRALGARILMRSLSGARKVDLADFFTGARETILESAELIEAVEIPAPARGSGSAYVKFGYRRGAQVAVASAAAWVVMEGEIVREARLVLGAVAPVPLFVNGISALLGNRPEGEALEAACAAASAECLPISDIRGSAAYRRAVVAVISRNAITMAAERATFEPAAGGRP